MNYFNENEAVIFENVFRELGITRKTKRFWDYMFENHLVPEYLTDDNSSNGSFSAVEVAVKQIKLAQEYKENISGYALEKMFKKVFPKDVFCSVMDNLIQLGSERALACLIKANSFQVNYDLGEKLLGYFNINELYEMGVTNETLLNKHISDFDKKLFYKLGFKGLSARFIESQIVDMEALDMSDIKTNCRPNISIDESPLYENGGCCLEETHTNGASIYIPYGIWSDIFSAIKKSTKCMNNEIQSLKESARKLDVEDVTCQTVKSNLEIDIENLEKQKLLLENFSFLKSLI